MAILGKSKIKELKVGTGQSSVSPSTGAEVINGGLGVQENLNVGGAVSAGNIEHVLTDDSTKIPSSKAVFEGTIKTATATSEKVSADTPPDVTVTTEDRNSNFHFKIPAGERASMLSLVSDTYVFPCEPTGCPKPNTYTVTAIKQNLTDSTSWTLSNEKSYTNVESIEIHTDDIVSNVGNNLAITDGTIGDEEYKWSSPTASNSTVNFKTTNLPLGKVYRLRAWCTVTANDSSAGKVYVGYTDFNDSETHWDSVYEGMAVGSSQFFSVTMYAESKATADPHFMLYAENCSLTITPAETELYEVEPAILEITATAGEFSDKISIVPVKDGLIGETPYFMVLSTYNVGFIADEDGNIQDGQLGEVATLKIFHGNDGEDLSEWSLQGYVSSGTVSTPVISADGKISISSLTSDTAIITVVGTKGDISVDQSLRLAKVKSGASPYLLTLENDNYTFTVTGGNTPALADVLPQAVSGIRILRGDEEQTFTVGSSADGWGVSAVFTAIVNDASSSDTSLFNGDIQADGTVRVTILSPTLQYGEIAITASNAVLGITLDTTVSIRLQKSAGFGTPTASTTTLNTGEDATVSVSASGDETSKVFSFNFGIPRGDSPIFISMNPDAVPVPCSSTGAILESAFPLHTSITVYDGTEDVTSEWSYSINWSGETANGTVDAQGNVSITDYANIESTILTVTATKIGSSPLVTMEKGFILYKARSMQGAQGIPGSNATISSITASIATDESTTEPSITATSTPVSGQDNAYSFSFVFTNVTSKLYDIISNATDGAITPNAVRTALSSITFTKAIYSQTISANNTLSTYVIPNYTAGQDIEVFYNGLFLLPGTSSEGGRYTIDSAGTITFNTALGGTSVDQQLIVVARTLSSGGN